MERYICIHGHFYQPPRENPWLEEVELQDSAYPYHDWNDRITEECYRPNTASRILAADKRIIDIDNNYTNISFDFGPTLLTWLQRHEPEVYASILDADKKSQDLFGGHGAAMAQVYNHIIMPLAHERDKRTQVLWGIHDFQTRFGRLPEGMWLAETAVDIETLDILAEYGIKFTILAPAQAKAVAPIGKKTWTPVDPDALDTTQAYVCPLPSGRSIQLFFYHGPTAQKVAFGQVIQNGEHLAHTLLDIFNPDKDGTGLAHFAVDGETFGHHHRHTDMALAYALHYITSTESAKVTVYGQYLEDHPPVQQVQIHENTCWSCAHGIERWRSNCGCHYGRYPSGQQQWREPLRRGMDWLRDQLASLYEHAMSDFTTDVWALRNHYISVINDRSPEHVEHFIMEYTGHMLDHRKRTQFLKLLEMQRNALLMYTSCGWFFDDIAGIETVQVLLYACRAIQLAKEVADQDLEPDFEDILQEAPCNAREYTNGKDVYTKLVKTNSADLNRVGAHLAVSSLFEEYPETMDIYCYSATIESYDRCEAGIQILASGRATITSKIVLEKHAVDFAVLHFGDRNIMGGVKGRLTDEDFLQMQTGLRLAFDKGDTTAIMRLMNLYFGSDSYSLWHLFKDQQRRILNELLETTWQEIELAFRQIYERNFTIMQLMRGMNMPLPKELANTAEFIINQDLRRTITAPEVDLFRIRNLLDEAARLSIPLDENILQYEVSHKVNTLMDQFAEDPHNPEQLEHIEQILQVLLTVASHFNIQSAQNTLFNLSKNIYPVKKTQAQKADAQAQKWVTCFQAVAYHLGVAVE